MTNSLIGADGKPDMDKICASFPDHGNGVIDHSSSYGHDFSFEIYWAGYYYEAVILSQPGYGSRSESLHATHRLPGPDGYAKICFANQPTDLPTTVALALWWAESTSKYIRTGGSWQ